MLQFLELLKIYPGLGEKQKLPNTHSNVQEKTDTKGEARNKPGLIPLNDPLIK